MRSVGQRRRELETDRTIRELLEQQPGTGRVIDAYLWAYPRSPRRSKASLAAGLLAIGAYVCLVVGRVPGGSGSAAGNTDRPQRVGRLRPGA